VESNLVIKYQNYFDNNTFIKPIKINKEEKLSKEELTIFLDSKKPEEMTASDLGLYSETIGALLENELNKEQPIKEDKKTS